jgi:hypothetical protein
MQLWSAVPDFLYATLLPGTANFLGDAEFRGQIAAGIRTCGFIKPIDIMDVFTGGETASVRTILDVQILHSMAGSPADVGPDKALQTDPKAFELSRAFQVYPNGLFFSRHSLPDAPVVPNSDRFEAEWRVLQQAAARQEVDVISLLPGINSGELTELTLYGLTVQKMALEHAVRCCNTVRDMLGVYPEIVSECEEAVLLARAAALLAVTLKDRTPDQPANPTLTSTDVTTLTSVVSELDGAVTDIAWDFLQANNPDYFKTIASTQDRKTLLGKPLKDSKIQIASDRCQVLKTVIANLSGEPGRWAPTSDKDRNLAFAMGALELWASGKVINALNRSSIPQMHLVYQTPRLSEPASRGLATLSRPAAIIERYIHEWQHKINNTSPTKPGNDLLFATSVTQLFVPFFAALEDCVFIAPDVRRSVPKADIFASFVTGGQTEKTRFLMRAYRISTILDWYSAWLPPDIVRNLEQFKAILDGLRH